MERIGRTGAAAYVRVALALAVLGAGFAAGWLARGRAGRRNGPAMHMIREQQPTRWRFISPLLECDAAEDLMQRPVLVSFRERILSLVDSRRAAGQIMFASVYFRELNDGPWIGVKERIGYLPASLLKLPTLIAVLKRAEREPGFLEREAVFPGGRDDNRMIYFRPPETLVPGERYTVRELCRRMTRYSDNNATRMLNELVTLPEQEETLRGLGVLPELLETDWKLNVKTVSSFFRVLYNASYLGKESSEMALEMLSQAHFRRGIAAGVPAGVAVCSKYGEAAPSPNILQLHEFAIVYHEQRPYLLGVMTQGSDFAELASFIRDVSRMVFEEVDRKPEDLSADMPGTP